MEVQLVSHMYAAAGRQHVAPLSLMGRARGGVRLAARGQTRKGERSQLWLWTVMCTEPGPGCHGMIWAWDRTCRRSKGQIREKARPRAEIRTCVLCVQSLLNGQIYPSMTLGGAQWRVGIIIGAMHRSRGRRVWPLIVFCGWLQSSRCRSFFRVLALNPAWLSAWLRSTLLCTAAQARVCRGSHRDLQGNMV